MIKTKSDSIATFVPVKTHPYRSWFMDKKGKPISFSKKFVEVESKTKTII